MSLRDPSSEADVLAGTIVVTGSGSLASHRFESIDPLLGD
jgi:hypothetical protein